MIDDTILYERTREIAIRAAPPLSLSLSRPDTKNATAAKFK